MEENDIITKKLNVMDYIFRYKGEDLGNCKVEYYFDKMTVTNYKEGSYDVSLLNIFISASDKLTSNYTFEYAIKMSLDELNKLSDKPNNINEYIYQGETYFSNPYTEDMDSMFIDLYLKESMYYDQSNFYVSKLEDNKFIFKVSIPEEYIFMWFIIDFNEN